MDCNSAQQPTDKMKVYVSWLSSNSGLRSINEIDLIACVTFHFAQYYPVKDIFMNDDLNTNG